MMMTGHFLTATVQETSISWYQNVSILDFIEAKYEVVVVTSGAIRCAKFQSNRHHQQINTQLYTWRMSFLSPNQQCQCQSIKGKKYHIPQLSNPSLPKSTTTSTV